MSRSTPIIFDTDPGIDDAVALMLLAASPEIHLLGITTVAGNVGIETTTRNALALCELLQLQVPVAAGAWRTLSPQLAATAAHVHGTDGLGGWRLPAPLTARAQAAQDISALTLMSRLLRKCAAAGQRATILAVGPLTNVAQLLVADAQAAELIAEIVLMGGGFAENRGNATAYAEFNIHTDPHAAAIVFNSGVPVRMVGLNVTESATLGVAHLPELMQQGGPIAEGVQTLLRAYVDVPDQPGLTAQHDALAAVAAICPDVLEFTPARVRVVTQPGKFYGETVVELLDAAVAAADVSVTGQACVLPVRVATGVDVAAFRRFMGERLCDLALKLAAGN